jgi:hypothetical protein
MALTGSPNSSPAVLLDRIDQRLVACQRLHRIGQQQALDVHRDAGAFCGRIGDHLADRRLDLDRVLFGDHAAVQLEHHLAGHDVGVGAAFDAADVEVGVRDALDLRGDLLVERVLRVERVEDLHRALQRIDAGGRNGGVRHLAVHRHFHLQAAVVGRDHFVAEAGRDHEVGLGQALLQQPARAEDAAEFFVVGEVQLDAALGRLRNRFERAQCEGEAREVALAHSGGAAVEAAVGDLAAVGVVRPAFARRHHVAVGVERDRQAAVAVAVRPAIFAAHDQVGDRFEAVVLHFLRGHGVLLGIEAEVLQQLGGALGVRCVVAGRGVGGHAHEFLQELHFLVEVGVDPGVELMA